MEQLEIEAPAIVLVEAKRDSLNSGIGQCMAEMIAAQRFNQQNDVDRSTIYGATTSGTAWRFLKLEAQTVTIDLTDYALFPNRAIARNAGLDGGKGLARSTPTKSTPHRPKALQSNHCIALAVDDRVP